MVCVYAELTEGVVQYLLSCQTYEGGFGGEGSFNCDGYPSGQMGLGCGNEAHGGYNFCALASLHILGKVSSCDLSVTDCMV